MDELQSTIGGSAILPPVSLTSEQEDLCIRLDDLYSQHSLTIKPSELFRGTLFAMRAECQSNPDWIAQAANSLREILYPFWSPQVKTIAVKKSKALEGYGSVFVSQVIQGVNTLYGRLNDLAHHGATATNFNFLEFSLSDFEKILAEFENVMRDALTRQLDLHSELDSILDSGPTELTTAGSEDES